ncbi:MAG: DUF2461 domain-containing protein [Clostridia bacterium]|nr:DUF2461 domain-containing protein [Clostridia bacterium]
MFTGFTDETIQFLLDLKFHNNSTYFHEQHDRYVETVQTPFYEMICDLSDDMRKIDPLMETRPHKCLSRIHRDTRFSRDKSPYRDHHWFLFRRAAEPRDKSLFYYFEFGPDRLGWGMGIWGENRELMDLFRKRMRANPDGTLALIDDMDLVRHKLLLDGSFYKRMEIPPEIPQRLKQWYCGREIYIHRYDPEWKWAFSDRLIREVRKDFLTLAPMYRLLRGWMDDIQKDRTE